MAKNNRERIDDMFELLAGPLDAFIQRSVSPQLNGEANWTALVLLRDEGKGIKGNSYNRADPQLQLRMITENIPNQLRKGWYPFSDVLGRVGQSYCSELRDARNAWA